ncbi:hypothetical protein KKB84_02405 [bacterium]|nr:hypothetical protein [bacterium]
MPPKSLVCHYTSATLSKIESLQLKNGELFKTKWEKVLKPIVEDYMGQLKKKGIRKLLIYGTGRGEEMLHSVLKENNFEVLGFMDSNPKKWGEVFLDKRIFSFAEAKTCNNSLRGSVAPDSQPLTTANCYDAILIASQFIAEIKDTLRKNGLTENIIAPIIFSVK